MKLPHPLKNARKNREKMKQNARQRVVDYDKGKKARPVSNQLIGFIIIGFGLMLVLKLVQHWIGD